MPAAGGVRAGRAFVEIGAKDVGFQRALTAAQQRLRSFGVGLTAIGAGVTAGATAVLAPLTAAVLQFSSAGDAIEKMAARTGASAEALSELAVAAELSGTSMESMEKGLRLMQRTIAEAANGSAEAAASLALLGLSAQQLAGMSPDKQLEVMASRLAAITDDSQRTAAAMRVFGRSGADLIPMLSGGSKGIQDLRKQANDLGLTVSTETAASAARLNDALFLLLATVKKVTFEVGAALAPAVSEFAERVAPLVGDLIRWVQANQRLIVSVAKIALIVLGVGVAITALGIAIIGVGAVLGSIGAIIAAAGAALVAVKVALLAVISPIGIMVALLGGAAVALLYFTGAGGKAVDWLRERFATLWASVSEVIGGIRDALAAGDLGAAADVAWAAIKVGWTALTTFLRGEWAKFVSYLSSGNFFADVAFLYQMAWISAFHAVEVGWAHSLSLMRTMTRNWMKDATEVLAIVGDAAGVGNTIRLGAAVKDAEFFGAQGSTGDLDKRLAEANRGFDAGIKSAIEQRDKKRAENASQTDPELAKTLASGQAELEAAKQRLKESIEAARKARQDSERDQQKRKDQVFRDAQEGLEIGGQVAKAESRGTFSAAAARGLEAPNLVVQRLDHMVRLLTNIEQNTESSGLVFAEGA